MYRHALLALFLVQAGAPRFRIEAPSELAPVRTRLEAIDRRRFADIAELVGLDTAGADISVRLASESSDVARGVSAWISGFAIGGSNQVVLFPARSPTYPDNTLEDVLRHEVAHILIWRASGGRPIPRWFNEGLAMAAERDRGFGDQTQLLYQLVIGSRLSLGELDRLFEGGRNDQVRAYALAGAMVHDLLQRQGKAAAGKILMNIGRGASFDAAFAEVTGMTPADADLAFWRGQRIWTAWVPIITSSATLWMAVTLLAILAIYRRRQRNLEIERRWDKEEEEEEP